MFNAVFIDFIMNQMHKGQRKPDQIEKRGPRDPIAPAQRPPSISVPYGVAKPLARNIPNVKASSGLPESPSLPKISSQQRSIRREQQYDPSNSKASKGRLSESFMAADRVVQLHQRLKNIHHFYKTRLQDQKSKVAQRNEVFMGMVEQMQRSHTEKVNALRKLIEQAEGEKKDVGIVDQRMNEIKNSIDQILKQSADLKLKNQKLERQINEKAHSLRQKQEELSKIKDELMESRNQLQTFQRLNLKENKRSKDVLTMISKNKDLLPQ